MGLQSTLQKYIHMSAHTKLRHGHKVSDILMRAEILCSESCEVREEDRHLLEPVLPSKEKGGCDQ
jgi:hypothetical protein